MYSYTKVKKLATQEQVWIENNLKLKGVEDVAQLAECLPSINKDLHSNSSNVWSSTHLQSAAGEVEARAEVQALEQVWSKPELDETVSNTSNSNTTLSKKISLKLKQILKVAVLHNSLLC